MGTRVSTIQRRTFLRGLGGAVVAAPLLPSVVERAHGAGGTGDPQRLIVMFTHYGCVTDRWFPAKSHGSLLADDLAGTSLDVLAPHVDKLLMPRGIRAMNEWTSTMVRGQGNDPHTQVVGTYFTGVPVTPNSDEPFSFLESTKFKAMPTAPSLDHICARQLQPDGQPFVLHLGGVKDTPQSGISYSAGETPFVGHLTVAEAFSSLTGLFGSGVPTSPDSYRALRGQSVIDLIREDLEAFERFDMSAADRQKLETWKELLDQTGRAAAASAECSQAGALALGLDAGNFERASVVPEDGDALTVPVGGGLDGADLFANVAVLAALCDAHRVIVLDFPPSFTFRGLGLTAEAHMLSHRLTNPAGQCTTGVNDLLQTIDRYYAAKFAHLISTLDAFEEGSGSLLDNSATVWFQEMSDGNAHNLNNLPILQAGSCGGYFKTGHAVNVEDGAADLSRGNSSLACEPQGPTNTNNSGTPPELANAPINKYFCTLMNAIGVKAGADGFPAPGGTQEVTHFGMYDRTEDFVGGGTNPPLISDPGEFSALRA